MTTRYRVEYALKSHRRDQLIEWIKAKGLLAVPFVLHSQPTAVFEPGHDSVRIMAETAHKRYAEIMRDVEGIINDHILHQREGTEDRSKLRLLVPSVSVFFTPLALHDAFVYQDNVRFISRRRYVPPSFNDVRLILNTAQIMSLIRAGPLELVTFDGDVTLYDDGQSLTPDNPVIPRILGLMAAGTRIGIVTAAGYTESRRYYERLHGLLDALHVSALSPALKQNLVIMGGESNYCFAFDSTHPDLLRRVPPAEWALDEMLAWTESDITELLDVAEAALRECVSTMSLATTIVRKDRAVGIIPLPAGPKLTREQLEETVLITQKVIEMSPVGRRLPFCAFNGGNDVFVDIGDKSWGVLACQKFFGGVESAKTLHVGDQFLSAGANDFKARMAGTTAWIAGPGETVGLLDEIEELERGRDRKIR